MIEKLEFLSLLTDILLKIELNPKVVLEKFQNGRLDFPFTLSKTLVWSSYYELSKQSRNKKSCEKGRTERKNDFSTLLVCRFSSKNAVFFSLRGLLIRDISEDLPFEHSLMQARDL